MIVESIINSIIYFVSITGYFGIFLLMILESMVIPIPSEAVLPFAGYLIYLHQFNFLYVVLASSFGSLIGSLVSYYIGYYLGRPFIINYGKYFLLKHKYLEITERFFSKNGEKTVFISRFIPVVRHLISIPAGVAKMNVKKFSLYSLIGATIWDIFLIYLGFKLGKNWDLIHRFSTSLDILAIVILIMLLIYFIYRKRK